jgi:folate receptor
MNIDYLRAENVECLHMGCDPHSSALLLCVLGRCLRGDRHKELACPQPEGPEYQACFQWSDQTCCTAEFTEQLAGATVRNIDGFHWSRCEPPLSDRCEEYFKRVECFYR